MRLKVIRNHVWSTWGRVPDKEDTDYGRRGDIGGDGQIAVVDRGPVRTAAG